MSRLIVVAVTTVAALACGGPAGAHTGGRAELYVAGVHVDPRGERWSIQTEVRDRDSGRLEPGFEVAASGRSPGSSFGPVRLADTDNDGRYEAEVPLGAGDWSITISAKQFDTGQQALPFERTWSVSLEPGQAFDIGGGSSRRGDGSGLHLGLIAVVVLVLIVAGLLLTKMRNVGRHMGSSSVAAAPRNSTLTR